MTTTSTDTKRIEMRVDLETKLLAERASAALGCASLTEFITRLIRENSPAIIKQYAEIQLNNEQFEHFMAVCNDTSAKPSLRILKAAQRLDKEGF
jgi:uncharacterized protein (DUF1778 family)